MPSHTVSSASARHAAAGFVLPRGEDAQAHRGQVSEPLQANTPRNSFAKMTANLVMVTRYSERLLLSVLSGKRSSRPERFALPLLLSAQDELVPMSKNFEAVADITTGEAVELSLLADVFLKTIEQSGSDIRPQLFGVTLQ